MVPCPHPSGDRHHVHGQPRLSLCHPAKPGRIVLENRPNFRCTNLRIPLGTLGSPGGEPACPQRECAALDPRPEGEGQRARLARAEREPKGAKGQRGGSYT